MCTVRLLLVLFLVSALCSPLAATGDPLTVAFGLQTASQPAVAQIVPLAEQWLQGLVASSSEAHWQALFAVFPIGADGHKRFRERVNRSLVVVGPPEGVEFLGYRGVGASQRYWQLVFLSHHPRSPIAWEFTFYRPRSAGSWQLNLVRFESDAICEFVSLPQLEFERLTSPGSTPPPQR